MNSSSGTEISAFRKYNKEQLQGAEGLSFVRALRASDSRFCCQSLAGGGKKYSLNRWPLSVCMYVKLR